jgi:tripartite-type tricarboxylate transporter receptor subunit TctC
MIVTSGAGGGYDTYSRLLARHFPTHIPGRPNVVVKNMPGAGSRVGLNYVANVAPRDGTVVAVADSVIPLSGLFDPHGIRFNPLTLNWIGSVANQLSICVSWIDSSFKSIEDVMQRTMRVSGTGTSGWRVTLPRLFAQISGAKFVTVPGYATTESFLAVERREVDGTCPTYDTLLATKRDWLLDNKVRILMQFGLAPAAGLEDVPLARDKVVDPADRAALELILSQQLTGRPYFTVGEIPTDRAAALRAAFEATMRDPAFLAEAKRMHIWIDPLSSAQIHELLTKAYATPPPIIERARSLLMQSGAN